MCYLVGVFIYTLYVQCNSWYITNSGAHTYITITFDLSSYFLIDHIELVASVDFTDFFHLYLSTYVLLEVYFWLFLVLYSIDYSVKIPF